MSEDGGKFFGFIDILKGLTVIPKIIMFLGIVAVLSGFFAGSSASCGIRNYPLELR